MRSFRKWLLLILIALSFIELNIRPSVEERLFIELNDIRTEIVKGKALFNEMRYNNAYTTITLDEMGCDFNYFIILFNEKLRILSSKPYFKRKNLLLKEIELIEVNCP